MTRRKNPKEKIPPLSPSEAAELSRIVDSAALHYTGNVDELWGAVGMLMLGRLYGWRVLYIVHSKRTIKKYEEILGITVREFFRETGPLTERSRGYMVAQALGNFWRVVSGDLKVERRRDL